MKKMFQLECSPMDLTENFFYSKTKEELKTSIGLCYNDINCNVWMYRIKRTKQWLRYRYVYIVFSNNEACNVQLKRFKTCRLYKSQ